MLVKSFCIIIQCDYTFAPLRSPKQWYQKRHNQAKAGQNGPDELNHIWLPLYSYLIGSVCNSLFSPPVLTDMIMRIWMTIFMKNQPQTSVRNLCIKLEACGMDNTRNLRMAPCGSPDVKHACASAAHLL